MNDFNPLTLLLLHQALSLSPPPERETRSGGPVWAPWKQIELFRRLRAWAGRWLPGSNGESTTLKIISTSALIFSCYFVIGLQLAVVPTFVHAGIGYSALIAGLAISIQYVATLLSRPLAGRMSDVIGAKRATLLGLFVAAVSGLVFFLATQFAGLAIVGLGVLILGRLLLGFGESWIATGSTLWGMGRVGATHTAQVISWAGIASYGALAAGAPTGVWLAHAFGVEAVGITSVVVLFMAMLGAWFIDAVPSTAGKSEPFNRALKHVLPYGLSLALGGIGFGTIASFVTLYYASRNWQNAGLTLTCFGLCFVAARLLFADRIDRWGGFRVAIVSLAIESAGLALLWLANDNTLALAGAGLSGLGFSLVFPALGVEAVRGIPDGRRGTALGIYTAFVDLSLGIAGPIAGMIVHALGYTPIFLFAAVMSVGGMTIAIRLSGARQRRLSYYRALRASPECYGRPA